MHLTVYGKSKHVNSKLIREAARFYGKELLEYELYKDVKVRISIFKHLLVDGEECWGCVDSGKLNNKNPRTFRIWLNNSLNRRTLLTTLAHEFVHIKQYAKNTLSIDTAGRYKWKGEIVTAYYSAQYEREAYRREKKLYKAFQKQRKRK